MAQGVDIADVDGPLKTIRDRLIIGLSEVKKRRYLWGIQGQQLQVAPEQIAERFTQIHQQTKESIDTALEFMGQTENQELWKPLLRLSVVLTTSTTGLTLTPLCVVVCMV